MKYIEVKVLKGDYYKLPEYQTAGSSCMDLYANNENDITLAKGSFCMVPTGLHISIPTGYEAQVRPRSGLAAKHGVTVLNTPGTIDSDYRGEIKVILINHGKEDFIIKKGERIAQLSFAEVIRGNLIVSGTLDNTSRGHGGFGHTGMN